MVKKYLLLFSLLQYPSFATEPDIYLHQRIIITLQEAEDYLTVLPSKSIKLLTKYQDLSLLKTKEKIRWYIATIRAANSLNDLPTIRNTINQLLSVSRQPEFEDKLVSVLSSIGIYLRKSGHLSEAKLSFLCSLQHAKEVKKQVILLSSLAITARHQDDLISARNINLFARELADKNKLLSSRAAIENNLALIALNQNKLDVAEQYLLSALRTFQTISKRSSIVKIGNNLLLIYLLQDKPIRYQRIYSSIARLTAAHPNKTQKVHLLWVHSTFQQRQGHTITNEKKKQLVDDFNKLSDNNLQATLQKYLAKELGVTVKLKQSMVAETFQDDWFINIPSMPVARIKKNWI